MPTIPTRRRSALSVDAIYWRIDWKWAQVRGHAVSMGWKPGVGLHSARLAGLQRGDARRPAGDGIADAPDRRRSVDRLDQQLQGRLGPLHGLRAPELRAALRPPVLAPLDRLSRHPGRDHAPARHRLLRELAPRRLRAARLRDRQSEGLVRVRRQRLGLHRLRRPGHHAPGRPHGAARATFSTTRRAAPAARTRSTTARSRRPPPSRRCPSRPRSRSRPPRRCTRATASSSIRSTASSIRSTAASPPPTSRSPTAVSTRRSAGSRSDYLGIDQGPILGMICNYRNQLVWDDMRKCAPLLRGLARAGFSGGWLDQAA